MGQTIAEKIISSHSGKKVFAGEIVLAKVDFLMAQDGTAPLVIKAFEQFGTDKVFNPGKAAFVIDHNSPSQSQGVSALHKMMRDFSKRYGIKLFDIGEGVCHILLPENGLVSCGNLVLGADSHTPTYGALNVMSCGVGSTDLAIALLTGSQWFKVPQTIKIVIKGKKPIGVYGKDIALYIVKALTAEGATYKSVEITGPAIKNISMSERFTLCNLMTEVGAKCGIMVADKKTEQWLKQHNIKRYTPVFPDRDAVYEREVEIDISKLSPQVAKPHTVDNVENIEYVKGIEIQQAFIGTCTNGRTEDFAISAKILKGRKVKNGVRLICTPGSKAIYLECIKKGYIQTIIEAGGCVTNPGCGPCVGTHQGIPSDGENVISTANRNFKGRMGNQNAFIYLASPATVAASAIEGKIADPRKYLKR
ncbi:MAG: 3-isopropylmalate dehydratase large subunit [Candidatus Omnitrophica bacterium]|nr:3-isopropylmalate dehydratase large subunit [Candidatus Omnitrophota bacterium]MCM8777811.1 3-isopropylmalate dehydratase large subunit [Candidatus Omnitrophota bacterium]